MKTVLLNHFFNEEWLLPSWVCHHVELFDEAILLDYESTDSSVEIIRELAPHWEIRTSQNRFFDAISCDQEIMWAELEIGQAWKMCLCTTEFLFTKARKLNEYLENITVNGIGCKGLFLVDPVWLENDEKQPILKHHHYGVLSHNASRLLHRYGHGNYSPGRHGY